MYLLQKELEARQRAAPLLFYRFKVSNHPKQKAFHEGLKQGKRFRLFTGGNRSGKTTAGKHEALAHAYGYRYWEVPDLKLQNGDLPSRDSIPTRFWVRRADGIPVRVPNVGMVVSGLPRLRGIGENIYPGLQSELPEALRAGKLRVLRGAQGVPDWVELPNGSRVLFATEEQDDMTFEGFTLDWCWVDEPIRESIHNALQARLFDFRGSMWYTLTPLGAKSAWLYETFVNPVEPRADVLHLQVRQRDNPGNTEEQLKEFENNPNFSDRERKARLYGEFECLGDRVFDTFDPRVHVIKAFLPPTDWIHGCTVDPHHKRPAFIAWWAYNQHTRTYHFYREWPPGAFHKLREGALPPAEYATVIRNAEGRVSAKVRVCDPRFGKAEHSRHGFRETSWVELMAQYGLHFDANVPNVGTLEYGHDVINDLLRFDKNFPISPTNSPRLFLHDCCPNLAASFMNYGYLDTKDAIKGLYRKVSEEYKDGVDVVRYTVLYPIPVTADQIKKLQRFTAEDLRRENDYEL